MSAKKQWRSVVLPAETNDDPEFQYLSQFEELDGSYEILKTKPSKASKRRSTSSTDVKPVKTKKRRKSKEKRVKTKIDKESIEENKLTEEGVELDKVASKLKPRKNAPETPKPEQIIPETSKPEQIIPETSKSTDDETISWMEFGLADEIIKALRDLNFTAPTAIQKLCIMPAIRDGLDILGAAETGSGKTLAFGIPIVQGILNSKDEDDDETGAKALILTPTRELAVQIKQHISAILKYTSIKITTIIGGLSVQKQERLLKRQPEIIVATPGRLWAMIEEKNEGFRNLSKIRYLVIDETDRMVEKGHFLELSSILDYLKADDSLKRQTFVYSATLTFVHPAPKRLVSKVEVKQMTPQQKIDMLVSLTGLRKERKVVDISRKFGTCESLVETRLNCSNLEEKDVHLYYFLLNYPGRTLIFANSVNCTRRLKNLLNRLNFSPLFLHAQMHQKQRLTNLEKFSESPNSILLATDVAARGLDIKNIHHVVHYQVPRTAEIYVHRSGRTARANSEGISIMLVDTQDALNYKKICQNLNREQDLPLFPVKFIQIPMLRDRIKVATELESLEHQIDKLSASEQWFSKSAREADLDLDADDIIKTFGDSSSVKKRSLERQSLQKQLTFLLKHPLPRDGLTTKYPTSITDVDQLLISNANSLKENALENVKSNQNVKKIKGRGMKIRIKEKKKKFKNKRRKR